MNNELLEMQYFDWTGVWGINGRNGYSTFEYLCISAISLIGKAKMNNARPPYTEKCFFNFLYSIFIQAINSVT